MRTTIRFDPHLLAAAKQRAAERGVTLTAVLEQALRESLARRPAAAQRNRIRLKTVSGSGTRRDVDLDDSVALRDLMDS